MRIKILDRRAVILVFSFCCFCRGIPGLHGQITGGMLDPKIDLPGEPFSYFWHPTDVIGSLYAPVATEVTPEGYLYTGFGELMFFVGNPPEAINQRVKTLYKGYLPVVQYQFRRDGVNYAFSMFAADLGGGLKGLPVNFIKVEVRNTAQQERVAFLTSALRYGAPATVVGRIDYRFAQRFDLIPNIYTDGQSKLDPEPNPWPPAPARFNPDWKYLLTDDALIRDGRIVYLFPAQPEPYQVSLSFGDNGFRIFRFFSGEVQGSKEVVSKAADSYTPMGVATYRLQLEPGQTKSLTFKMPIVPLPEGSVEARQVHSADYEQNFRQVVSFWEELVGNAAFRFPEDKVQHALLANTIFDLLAVDKVGDDTVTNDNKFQYHRYYPTDSSLMNVAFDDMGLHKIAREVNLYALRYQKPDGSLVQHSSELFESFGHVLWSWERHYLLTRDADFLQQIYPGLLKAMDWEMDLTRKDPLGLMPAASVHDDAQLKNCHQTGMDLWALAGIKNAIVLAEAMGKDEDLQHFTAEYQRFWAAFEKQLNIQTAKTGGYIPPSLDRTLAGNDWDNLHTLYPEPLFEPFDPRVTATIRKTRRTYLEGILPYLDPMAVAKKSDGYVFQTERSLHYFHSPDNAENQLVRGDPEDQVLTVKDLYALLLHTTSTHATQEWGTYPWSTRDYAYKWNILPDGSTSAVLIELMRNMLVREYKNDLFLFSAVSPAWLKPGKKIEVVNAPTIFGPVTANLSVDPEGWNVELSNEFRQPPNHIVIRVPWFYEARSAEADGQEIKIANGRVVLSPRTRQLKVKGKIKPGTPEMSFEKAVRDYRKEYLRRHEKFKQVGTP